MVASMGPSTDVDGEPAAAIAAPAPRPRFNGAVDRRRRRGSARSARRDADALASMGPSTDVDGEVESAACRQSSRSLQWGRRQTSTERRVERRPPRESVRASMGPSTDVDGEPAPSSRGRRRAIALQWGRRQTSTESTRRPSRTRHARRVASMGPSTDVDGELERVGAPGVRAPRFNGAVDRRRRRAAGRVAALASARSRFNGAVDRRRRRARRRRGRRPGRRLASMGPSTDVDGEREP